MFHQTYPSIDIIATVGRVGKESRISQSRVIFIVFNEGKVGWMHSSPKVFIMSRIVKCSISIERAVLNGERQLVLLRRQT